MYIGKNQLDLFPLMALILASIILKKMEKRKTCIMDCGVCEVIQRLSFVLRRFVVKVCCRLQRCIFGIPTSSRRKKAQRGCVCWYCDQAVDLGDKLIKKVFVHNITFVKGQDGRRELLPQALRVQRP